MENFLKKLAAIHLPKNGIAACEPSLRCDRRFEINVEGWDQSSIPEMFSALGEEVKRSGQNLEYRRIDTKSIQSPEEVFDVVIPGACVCLLRYYMLTIPEKIFPEDAKAMRLICFMGKPIK